MGSSRSRTPWLLAGVTLVAVSFGVGAVANAATGSSVVGQPVLPSVGTNFSAAGPFATTSTVSGSTTYFYPTTAASDGLKHPVIIWGNGYGTATSAYNGLLKHLASHGFIVAAADTTNAGTGTEMLAGIDGIKNVPAIASAADVTRIGATGHSMGGIGSLKAAADKRVRTVFPLEGCRDRPSGLSDKTVAIFQASGDTVATSTNAKASCYDNADYAVAFIEFKGGSHGTPSGDTGAYRNAVTAWARWQLADDANAKPLFAGAKPGLAGNSAFSQYLTNSKFQALYAS